MAAHRDGRGTEHVDAVVVGSGFGGSVAAYRLAQAGLSVVVLERGRAYPPGSFPRSPAEMKRAFWDPHQGLQGLFDVWRFNGFSSVVSSGLGGGSLIYANVLLRKDERWFVRDDPLPGGGYETWPITRADLDPHYDAVEAMLTPAPYPFREPAYSVTPKTAELREAAAKLHLKFELPPLAVSFAPAPGAPPGLGLPIAPAEYGNVHGLPRQTCRLCGECDIGCNDGAKNTLDHTYLSAAAHHDADIRTRCEVRAIRRGLSGGYEVSYVHHDPSYEGHKVAPGTLPQRHITCDRLILAAGTYGTTLLLLRSRAELPGLSDALGTRFCGNGDLLTFLLPGRGAAPALLRASRGPVITAAVRVSDGADGGEGRGYYVQDGGYPAFVDWLAEYSGGGRVRLLLRAADFAIRWLYAQTTRSADTGLSSAISGLLSDGTLSSGSLPLLGMGRDIPDGVMRLRDGRLDVRWSTRTSMEYFQRVRATMRAIADELGASYIDNPVWFSWFVRRIITVHPLGGAPMGDGPHEGVCDANGEVFDHPDLYVLDGAAMPGPVGPNPSLTIAAFADRACTRMLERVPA
ncbi:GMC oxidoreductase [Planobispora siamensis]|uniref:Cholesterol oxidase n=1 Tax=Planobispora siamensis TaxID=936338 RepID=A0A8J3SKX1_9ACTN|nr:GMC family oxidoreductase [Planobispora siamensis]GIH94224.1 cholesterol oxidase [Planobispora siamensis]